jgi:hypothetical protein
MKPHRLLSRAATAALTFGVTAPLLARPGSLAPGAGSVLEKSGDVLAASIGEDGSVTLAGLFSRVDGVSAPGVVRLKSSGAVDGEFTSGIGISPPATVPRPGQPAALTVPCPVFVDIGGGGQLIGDPDIFLDGTPAIGLPLLNRPAQWFVLGDVGAVQVNLFTTITQEEPVMPQFVEDGKLVAIVTSPEAGEWRSKVRRLRLDTGADDPGFDAAVTGTPSQVSPAGNGGLWVLENATDGQRVLRLAPDGSLQANAAPLELSATRTTLQPLPAGSLAVSSSLFGWSDDLLDWGWTHRLQFLSASGTRSTPRVQTGGAPPFFIEPDGSLLVEANLPPGVDPLAAARWRELSRELPSGQMDAAFTGIRARRMVQRLTDGRLLADGTRRYLTSGAPDPSWQEPKVLNHGAVHALFAGPDGTVIGTGDFSQVDGQPRPGLARWRADGSLDLEFVPFAAEGEVKDCAVGFGGSVIVLRGGSLQRLHANGSTDAGFTLTWDDPLMMLPGDWEEVEALPGGDILALKAANVVRITPQGHCSIVTLSGAQIFNGRGLMVLPDGRFFHAGRRWLADGTRDTGFAPPPGVGNVPLCAVGPDKWLFHRGGNFGNQIGTSPPVVLRDDGTVESEAFSAALPQTVTVTAAAGGAGSTIYLAEGNAVVRRFTDGRRDVSFRAPQLLRRNESISDGTPLLSASRNGGDGAVYALMVHPQTGELWMAGDFTSADAAVRSGLARLHASTPAGYAAWSAAVFETSAAADADADGDGLTNFHEYAAGSDPLTPDATAGSAAILQTIPIFVSAPQNPAATEVAQTLELSEDLLTWRAATDGEAVRKTVNGRAGFELAPAAGPRFVRLRYRALP